MWFDKIFSLRHRKIRGSIGIVHHDIDIVQKIFF